MNSCTGLEKEIATYFGRKFCVLVGSGTAALFVAFKAGGVEPGDKVIYPDITCETAVNAAVFACASPSFCDVDPATYNIDLLKLKSMVKKRRFAVAVPTHIFGHLQDFTCFSSEVGESLLVVEDAAQAYTGEGPGRINPGQMGHLSVFSFGPGKLLDCGGGGAVFTDSRDLYERCRNIATSLCNEPDHIAASRLQLMKKLYLLQKRELPQDQFLEQRSALYESCKDGYVFQCDAQARSCIQKLFPSLDVLVKERRKAQTIFREVFDKNTFLTLPLLDGNPTLWRFSMLLPAGKREDVLAQLHKKKVKVSKLFSPMHRQYGFMDTDFPVAVDVYSKIINISFELDLRSVKESARLIGEVVNECCN